LASFWGTLVQLHECTRKRKSLHRAWLLVLTHEIESIVDSVQVEVNGHTFSIKMVEDPGGTYMWLENGEQIWEAGKSLGATYMGDETEVLYRVREMELRDSQVWNKSKHGSIWHK
ncbi:hypothetical protein Ancab_021133, partial [Ancistrocladus abbreviatus]